jgi:S-adenosylmethionine:tRNA ribosyltransferase-isomerase
MKTRDFSFNLPESLVAQYPPKTRGESRLLVARRDTRAIEHRMFCDLPLFLEEGSVVVLNDTRVRKARVYATACGSGGCVEFLFTERIDDRRWKAIASSSKRQKKGKRFRFCNSAEAEIEGEDGEEKIVVFDEKVDESFFETCGRVPLPPYIKREDTAADEERYQTVFGRTLGSAAAPTAGLHFSEGLIARLFERKIRVVYVTLHVGLATFLPIRAENVEDHAMHEEEYIIPSESARIIGEASAKGKDIVAIGTTVVRTLESAYSTEGIRPGSGRTGLFIYPGYTFRCTSRMLTNFHTPESSLLVLVSAFAGTDFIRRVYSEAIESGYRFFSYGDAMLIL